MVKHTITFHTIALARRLQKVLGFKSSPSGISHSKASAILVLDSKPNISQKELSWRVHLEPASVVTLIDELEKMDLVKREQIIGDRRKYQVVLTEKGKEGASQLRKQGAALENYLRNKLGPKKSEDYFKITEELLNHIETYGEGVKK